MKKRLLKTIMLLVILVNIILPVFADNAIDNVKAKVVLDNGIEDIEENQVIKKVQNLTIRILEGEYENEEYEMKYVIFEDVNNITSNIQLKKDDVIKVAIEENEGEVTNIIFKEISNSNYLLYILGATLIILLISISRKRAIIIYLVTIVLTGCIVIFSIQNGINLMIVSSILSILITILLFSSINGLKKDTLIMIVRAIIGIAISGVLIYILFDIMNLASINIKVTEKIVNIKELICSATILFSCGIYNSISISGQYIFYATNRPYKTKSDNIIEGQRSLKL